MVDAAKVGATNAGRDDPRSSVRRRDRGKDDEWVAAFLRRAAYGFLATIGQGGQPFLNSNLFVFDDTGGRPRIYLHTHRTGRTRTNLEAAEKVAFSAVAMGRLLPAPEALEFSVEYAGVGWHSGRDTSSKTAKKPGRPCGCSSTSTPRT